jgi:hypothetical protein
MSPRRASGRQRSVTTKSDGLLIEVRISRSDASLARACSQCGEVRCAPPWEDVTQLWRGAFRDAARPGQDLGGRDAPGLHRDLASKSGSIGLLGWVDSRREDALARYHRGGHWGFLRSEQPENAVIATKMSSCRQGAAAVSYRHRSVRRCRRSACTSRSCDRAACGSRWRASARADGRGTAHAPGTAWSPCPS